MATKNNARLYCGDCIRMDKERLGLKTAGFCKFRRDMRSYDRNAENCRYYSAKDELKEATNKYDGI